MALATKPLTLDDNALDLRQLCHALWQGKGWILATALLLALLALGYSYLAPQVWRTTAVTQRPGIAELGDYYRQQQFLQSLKESSGPSVTDDVPAQAYHEFVLQLASWDSRHDFWLQSAYFQQRKTGQAEQDAALLEKLINGIQYLPADPVKGTSDNLRITVDNGADAAPLLTQYVQFANQRAVAMLQQSLSSEWAVRQAQLQSDIARQEAVAQTVYQRRLHLLQQALGIAQRQATGGMAPAYPLADGELYRMGVPALQASIENLQAAGPSFALSYDQNSAVLSALLAGPGGDQPFRCWRYLQTPEPPITRDSPRRGYLMAMWGCVGLLIGAGIALSRRKTGPGASSRDVQ